MTQFYFTYSSHKTKEAAELALEDYFANGEISEAEKPYIQEHRNRGRAIRYCVMFPG